MALIYIGTASFVLNLSMLLFHAPKSHHCLRLTAVTVDYVTHEPLQNVHVFAKLLAERVPVGISDDLGMFSGEVPCEATNLLIEKTGYRSQVLSLNSTIKDSNEQPIAFLIPLIRKEGQSEDHTYLQTEQKAYIQQSSISHPTSSINKIIQHDHFLVTDAFLNTPLKANVCFIYTNTGARKCIDTGPNGKFIFDFSKADIVAIEATAPGYQRFEGNMIVESLDGRTLTHTIKLQRALTMLTVRAEKGVHCQLTSRNKTYAMANVPGHPNWFSTYEVVPEFYYLIVTHQGKSLRQPVKLKNGLNYLFLESEDSQKASNLVSSERLMNLPSILLDSLPAIYFEQSSYQLKPDSERILKQVALYLKHHKNYLLRVTGHTDNVGDKNLNKTLSDYRAAVVINYLVQQGIPEHQCLKTGLGDQNPISPNDTETNKALNRRVSLKLISTQ